MLRTIVLASSVAAATNRLRVSARYHPGSSKVILLLTWWKSRSRHSCKCNLVTTYADWVWLRYYRSAPLTLILSLLPFILGYPASGRWSSDLSLRRPYTITDIRTLQGAFINRVNLRSSALMCTFYHIPASSKLSLKPAHAITLEEMPVYHHPHNPEIQLRATRKSPSILLYVGFEKGHDLAATLINGGDYSLTQDIRLRTFRLSRPKFDDLGTDS